MHLKDVPELDFSRVDPSDLPFLKKTMSRYADCFAPRMKNKLRSVFLAIQKHPGKRVLEIGCGGGFFSCYLTELGYEVTGTDLSGKSIARAKCFAELLDIDVDFQAMDARNLEGEPYDIAFCFDVVEHIAWEHHEQLLKSVYDKLNTGGSFMVRAPHAYNIRQYVAGHIGLPTYEEFMGAARNVGFKPKVLIGHTGVASSWNYAVPLERFIDRVAPNEYWRYTFLKYFSLANVVVQLDK